MNVMIPQTHKIEELTFVIYEYGDDELQQLNEAKHKGQELVGTYSYNLHNAHSPVGDYHIHLYDGNVEILSMNKNGSSHDGYHGARFPNKAYKALVKKFPDWNWPANRIVESTEYTYVLPCGHDLRPVSVSRHRNPDGQEVDRFTGFFHQLVDDPFLAGGGQGFIARTVALIEKEDGRMQKVAVDCFRFLDV